jgi:O-antigen biosynthesis protein
VAPEVTVTMAAWKPRADWFHAAVESVLAEHGRELELVVVDDGSPEPVSELLSAVDDPRLRVVHVEHGGTAAARNAGIAAARGRLLRFVDADDIVAPGSTARLADLIGPRNDVVAYAATVVCDEELRPLHTIMSSIEGDAVAECLLGRFDVRHVSMMFPRQVVERAGQWRGGFALSEDWDFVLRALEHAEVRADPSPAIYYRRHRSSRTRAAAVQVGEADRRRIVEHYFERHPEQRGSRLEHEAFAALYVDAATKYMTTGDLRAALVSTARAVRAAPVAALVPAARLLARAALRPLR